MGFFPFFREIEGARILIVGGGHVAARRAKTLLGFNPVICAVAPSFCEEMEQLEIERIQRGFQPGDLNGMFAAVVATDDRQVNASVAALCREKGIEVNVADDLDAGTFLFPAVIRRSGMTVAITSGGASPVAAKFVRERLGEAIPENLEEVLARMEIARSAAKALLPDAPTRAAALRYVFDCCIHGEALPDDDEIQCMIRCFPCTEID